MSGYTNLVDRIMRAAGTGAEVRLRPQSVSMLASLLELSEARHIAIDYDGDMPRAPRRHSGSGRTVAAGR